MQASKEVTPEVVAAISAAVQMMGYKVKAVRIQRSDAWVMAARAGITK